MTDRELMQMSLDALEGLFGIPNGLTGEGAGGVAVWRLGGSYEPEKAIEALRTRLAEDTDVQYEVWQDDEWQAGSNSLAETMHYAMVYAQDGPAVVHEVTRREICKIEN